MLFSCGSNACGQLGREGDDSDILIEIELPQGKVQMDGGANHSMVVIDSILYASGSNTFGQLGLELSILGVSIFQKVKEDVEWVSCGWNQTFIKSGDVVYAYGENTYGQLGTDNHKIELRGIKKIKCGMRHSLFLTESGELYGCGLGKQGVLFSNDSSNIPILLKKNVQDIACGQFYSVYLDQGRVYVTGRNKFNVLLNECKYSLEPVEIDIPFPVVKIVSGWHTIGAITQDGRVYMRGRNDRGQAACTGILNQPTEIPKLKGCIDLVFGSEHGLALLEDKVFVWGWNEHGNLGIGNKKDVFEPVLLAGSFRSIASGAGHSLFFGR